MNKRLCSLNGIKWADEQLYHWKILRDVTTINDYVFNKNILCFVHYFILIIIQNYFFN